jgi:hypothetical protein
MKDEMTKLTAEIDRDIYTRIARDLHHGQMTQLVRAFAVAIDGLIQANKKDELYCWLYGDKELTLPPSIKRKEPEK